MKITLSIFVATVGLISSSWAQKPSPTASGAAAGEGNAAWEQPEIFSAELRTGFKSLRGTKAMALNQ